MEFLSIFLIIYGAILLFGFILQIPLFYRNPKSKALIKLLTKRGYDILLIIMGVALITIGILIR